MRWKKKLKQWPILSRFHIITERNGRTEGQTDGRTELLYQYRASVWWRAIKMMMLMMLMLTNKLSHKRTQWKQCYLATLSIIDALVVNSRRQIVKCVITVTVFDWKSYFSNRPKPWRRYVFKAMSTTNTSPSPNTVTAQIYNNSTQLNVNLRTQVKHLIVRIYLSKLNTKL